MFSGSERREPFTRAARSRNDSPGRHRMRHLPVVVPVFLAVAFAAPAGEQVNRERMRADLDFLCSPPIEGRASLSRGADAAAWFLASEMRKIGLQPAAGTSFLQRFDVVPLRLD